MTRGSWSSSWASSSPLGRSSLTSVARFRDEDLPLSVDVHHFPRAPRWAARRMLVPTMPTMPTMKCRPGSGDHENMDGVDPASDLRGFVNIACVDAPAGR
jgi:hypothetical protein